MRHIYQIGFLILLATLISCTGKTRHTQSQETQKTVHVGGDCEEGYCELLYKGMPDIMNAVDTSAGWHEKGQKLLVTGTVYQPDGKTPAKDIIVYYHHTDNDGLYSPRNDQPENQTRHGHIRGWMKTDTNGKYKLYTIRPASYPNPTLPAHVHWIIKEPQYNEYYIDDLFFDDDPFLTAAERQKLTQRGGNGISKTQTINGVQYATRDIILGHNIPNYPKP